MKIAILGTKGIPNDYGGYEQFAEYISTRLVERGHSVTVYNPSFHNYKETSYKGVKITRIYSPEKLIGGAANIIYDHLCLQDALKRDFDVLYEAGYHSVALSLRFLNVKSLKRPVVITNMDGLEWKRSKWNKGVQYLIEKLEKIAVNESPFLIADNIGIQEYLKDKFNKDSFFLPYGADPVTNFDETCLANYSLKQRCYFMLVARLEPENNIEVILEGHQQSKIQYPFIVVGNHKTKFGQYLNSKYGSDLIRFVGGIYQKSILDSIRYFSKAYFHGHSVGGTNPSLLEAMASKSFIWAHNNCFNKSVLNEHAFYFTNSSDVSALLQRASELRTAHYQNFQEKNFSKIKEVYNWELVVAQHEQLFLEILG